MAIKDNKTIDGEYLSSLNGNTTNKRIMRICDLCGKEDNIRFYDYIKQKERKIKKGIDANDTCYKCRYKVFPNGNIGKKITEEDRKQMSLRAKERNKDAKFKKVINGYAINYDMGKQTFVHRDNYENFHNGKLNKNDIIHHINIDSLDNRPENLIKLTPQEHSQLHRDLEKFAAILIKNGKLIFNKEKKQYYFNGEFENSLIPLSLGFNNIAIKQKKNICKSRLDVNIESEIIRGIKRPLPLIASNMSTVVNSDFCILLYKLGALGIMHRAANEDFILSEVLKISKQCDIVAASVGVGNEQYNFAENLIKAGANILVIDIAHGFCDVVFDMAKHIKNYSRNIKVIIGNTTNPEIFKEGLRYIDCVKLGIANGLACETKNSAGCNEGQFSVILKFKQISKDLGIPIISDGSIREPADFVKSIAAGASSAMMGSVFARCPQSAAEVIEVNGIPKKLYAGMASRYVQDKWKGGLKNGTCPEGKVVYLDLGEDVDKLLERYSGALRSGITYAGGYDIKSFQENVEFVRIL